MSEEYKVEEYKVSGTLNSKARSQTKVPDTFSLSSNYGGRKDQSDDNVSM